MSNTVPAVPPGFHSVTPALTCKNASAAIDYYKKAFGATEIMRMTGPGGSVMHAEIKIDDSIIFLGDEFPGMAVAPSGGLQPTSLNIYAPNVDDVFNRAVAAGAKVIMPLENMFWGDRYGKLSDPFGHQWGLAQHMEDVAPDEMERRSAEFTKKMAAAAGKA
jgi:PhnB protein